MKVLWLSQNLPYPPEDRRPAAQLQPDPRGERVCRRAPGRDRQAGHPADVRRAGGEHASWRSSAASVTSVHLPIEQSRARFLWVVVKSLFTKAPFTANWAICAGTAAGHRASGLARAVRRRLLRHDQPGALSRSGEWARPTALNHHNIESHLLERRVAYETEHTETLLSRHGGPQAASIRGGRGRQFDTNLVVSRLDGERLQEICPQGHHGGSGQRRRCGVLPPSVTDRRRSSAVT